MNTQIPISMKLYPYIPLIALTAALTGCGSNHEAETLEREPVRAEIATAGRSGDQELVSVSGKIEAGNSANISTRMMGSVTQVLVSPGDLVQKGDLLLTLSSTDLRAKRAQVEATVIQAESNFQNAQKDYERFRELFARGSASEKELDNMTTRYEAAEAGLRAAREMENEVNAQFAYTNLRAPFSGVVANTFVKVGDIANPGMPLAAVEGTNGYEATVFVPETHIAAIAPGADARVLIKSSGRMLKGRVTEVSPSAKNTGGQYLVKIGLQETDGIFPGMFVNADIEVKDGGNRGTASPVVNRSAIVRSGQLTGIYALSEENMAILRWVRLGREYGEMVEVLSGITPGEKYIVSAEGKLYNGVPVVVR